MTLPGAQNGSKGKPTAPGGPRGKAALAAARATIAAARQQLTPEEYAKQPCVDHRERELTGNICVDQAKCKRDHTCTGVVCTHPAMAKYGRCPDYFTKCHNTHPFPDTARKAYGSPQKGWNALKRDIADKKVAFAITDIDPANEVTGPRSGRGTTRPERGFELVAADSQAAMAEFMEQIPIEVYNVIRVLFYNVFPETDNTYNAY